MQGNNHAGQAQAQVKGRHILVECYDASYEALNDQTLIRNAMLRAVEEMQVTYLGDHFHKFAPQGVSGAVVIAESHLTIHTWPEDGYAAIDFFTCGHADPHEGFMVLARELGSATLKVVEMERGQPYANGGGASARKVAEMVYTFGGGAVTAPQPVEVPTPVSMVG